jgi:hypothetical protein
MKQVRPNSLFAPCALSPHRMCDVKDDMSQYKLWYLCGFLRVSYGFPYHSISTHLPVPEISEDRNGRVAIEAAASLPTRNRPEVTLSGAFTSWGHGEINQQMRKPKPGCVDMELRGQSWDPMPCLYLFILYILICCISKRFRARHFLSKDGSMPLREHYDLSLFLFLLPICFRDGPTWKKYATGLSCPPR